MVAIPAGYGEPSKMPALNCLASDRVRPSVVSTDPERTRELDSQGHIGGHGAAVVCPDREELRDPRQKKQKEEVDARSAELKAKLRHQRTPAATSA
jgi:hypothetical protein